MLRLGQPLPKEEWNASVVPPLLKAYGSPDRSTRMALLENLSLYAERMDNKVVVDKLWPNLITGFNDSVPVIREATLKAILPLAPKLSDRVLNNDLLRVLARTQMDTEAGIRTNTTILLGRLVPHLSISTRKKVLIPAFSRSLKDNFVHARVAGLMALMATGDSFDHEDCARQVLPAVAPCMVDKERLVRDQADKAMKMFLEKVESGRAGMPDTALTPEQLSGSTSFSGGSGLGDGANGSGYATTMAASAGSAATALAGWLCHRHFHHYRTPHQHRLSLMANRCLQQQSFSHRWTEAAPQRHRLVQLPHRLLHPRLRKCHRLLVSLAFVWDLAVTRQQQQHHHHRAAGCRTRPVLIRLSRR